MGYYYDNGNNFISQIPTVTKNLLAINILMFIATLINENFMVANFAMFYPASPFFKPWQILTHMFMHGNLTHLFLNMFALFMFGAPVERVFGSQRFLTYYLSTGFGAVALHTAVNAFEVKQDQDHWASLGTFSSCPEEDCCIRASVSEMSMSLYLTSCSGGTAKVSVFLTRNSEPS